MAWVVVEYSGHADVYINRAKSGTTGSALDVEEGHQDFAIGDADSSICPPVQRVLVRDDTTIVTPQIIRFPAANP